MVLNHLNNALLNLILNIPVGLLDHVEGDAISLAITSDSIDSCQVEWDVDPSTVAQPRTSHL